MKLFLKHVRDKVCIYRSMKVGAVVGTLLALINHYNAILSGTLSATVIFQILLTYLVPFGVAAYGSAMQARHIELQELKNKKTVLD